MQHDMVIDNQYAAQMRGDINNAIQSLATLSEGAAAPTITYANMLWADTTAGLLRKRNSANTAWGIVGPLNGDYGMSFPAGTRMPFNQTAAPTGWTKDTTAGLNDTAMRIVTGAVGSGGSVAFTTAFANQSVGATTNTFTFGATTLATSQVPNPAIETYGSTGAGGFNAGQAKAPYYYNDPVVPGQGAGGVNGTNNVNGWNATTFQALNQQGSTRFGNGGGSHTHTLTMDAHAHTINLAVKYNDFIIASKN